VQDRDDWQTPHSGHFTVKKDIQYPLQSGLGGPQGRSGRMWRKKEILLPPGFETRTAKSIGFAMNSIPAPESKVNLSNEDADKTNSSIIY
jgi:hypothetical protein